MIENIIEEVVRSLAKHDFSPDQLKKLDGVLQMVLYKYDITAKSTEIQTIDTSWNVELDYFLNRKAMSGASEHTVTQYRYHLSRALATINKNVKNISEIDLNLYLASYKKTRNVSNSYIDNIRRCLTSFFGWLQKKHYIQDNPAAAIDPIKVEKVIRTGFSDEELERIRRSCDHIRDRAIVEFLYATGVRVSEMVALNISDVSISEKEIIVFGKGSKEREVFLTPVCCLYLKEYLSQRTDDNPALFVGLDAPYNRIGKRGIESRLQTIGRNAGVENCHPHRFRRTMATNLLRKGMPIDEVKDLLGHENIETTLIYAKNNKSNLKSDHRKYMTS